MKCKKCNSEVSISETKCPKCGNDLLEFGSTVFYEPKEREAPSYGQTIKGMVIQELSKDIKEGLDGLDPLERKAFHPIENRLKTLLAQHLSDSEIESVFESEIVPTVDGLSKDKSAEKIFKQVEEQIKNNLGSSILDHYRRKDLEDVLKILRAGEITCILIRERTEDIDLSVKMFPFFKATEVACRLHSKDRYERLHGHPLIGDVYNWAKQNNDDEIVLKGAPRCLKGKVVLEVVKALVTGNKRHLSGALRTAISVFVFGRDWTLRIGWEDTPKVMDFRIKNILQTKGTDKEKELLVENLCKINEWRNKRIHEKIEDNQEMVNMIRMLSYNCLKQIPEILEI